MGDTVEVLVTVDQIGPTASQGNGPRAHRGDGSARGQGR